MIHTLSNEYLSIEADTLGAELKSLKNNQLNLEYLWQPGHEIWAGQAKNLFPNIGMILRERVFIYSEVYPMIQHGFARLMEFKLLSKTHDSLIFELSANERTKKYYPFEFHFQISYQLDNDILYQGYKVINADSRKLPFSVGAHTGFYCPIDLTENPEDYIIKFEKKETLKQVMLSEHDICTGEEAVFMENEDTIHLSEDCFNSGAKILKGFQSDYVTLQSEKSGRYVRVGFKGFPYLTLWSKPYKLYFICIEPWYGLPDFYNAGHNFLTKPGIQILKPGEEFYIEQNFKLG